MVTSESLAACVILTFQPSQLISLLLVQLHASSLDILLIIKGIAALKFSPIGSSSLAMWCLMRPCFLFPRSPPLLVQQILSFYVIILTMYQLLSDLYSLYLQEHLRRLLHSHVRPRQTPSPAPTQQLEQGLPPVLGAAACYIVIQILYK